MPRSSTVRVEFTKEHDIYLMKYLARYCPSREGRRGVKVFQNLVANEGNRWPWHVRHTWQSWRERYVKNQEVFDARIVKYQEKNKIESVEEVGKKRAAEPTPNDKSGRSQKRVKLQEENGPTSDAGAEKSATAQPTSSSPSTSKPKSKSVARKPSQPLKPPSQARPSNEPDATDALPPSPPRNNSHADPDATKKPTLDLPHETQHNALQTPPSTAEDARPSSPPRTGTNVGPDATKKPSLDLPALQSRYDTFEIPSSSSKRAASPSLADKPAPRSPPRAAKIRERPRTPSDLFASQTSSPGRDDVVLPRAPPRIVNSLHGLVLVDQKGHVPHVTLHEQEDVTEEAEEEDKGQWPPRRKAGGPDVGVDAHHAFSQPQPPPWSETDEQEQEQGRPPHPFEYASQSLDETPLDRRMVVAQFAGKVRQSVAPPAESERREDATWDGTSPVKRTVPTAPGSLLGLVPKPFPKPFKFLAPRASTCSPFRPDTGKAVHPPRPKSQTRAARHPALARLRRQTIGHADGNEHEHDQVPSIDLVALSHSSTSARSDSRSSVGESAPARPPRWSLPASAYATPWVLNEINAARSAPGSMFGPGSASPFQWAAPTPMYGGDIWARRHMQTTLPVGASTSQFMFTPSPAHSLTAVATDTSAPRLDAISASASGSTSSSPSGSIVPHPSDIALTASHGLASILAHMSANHGLALNVVEAVYARVGSLREADEVLKGMREAAEGFGEREIVRRVRRRQEERRKSGWKERRRAERDLRLRYVVASEDGEGSEYSPPETSRAAMWKRQSELARSIKKKAEEEEEEEEEDRQAQELERQMGRRRYRWDSVRRFI